MKRRYIAVLLGMMITAAPVSAYAQEASTEAAAVQEAVSGEEEPKDGEQMLSGEVTEVGEDTITVDGIGTLTVTTDTVISRQTMPQGGGAMEKPDGENGEAMEKPDGENGEVPEKADGENGEAMEKPDGENDEASEKPDGENGEAMKKPDSENGEAMEKPDGENGEAPEMPDGENGAAMEKPDSESGEAPEKPDGENGNAMEKPDGENGEAMGMSGMGMMQMETEEIALADIEVGDYVMVTLQDDTTAATITVQEAGMAGGQMPGGGMGGQAPGGQGVDSYEAVETYEEDAEVSGETVSSTGTDENAVLVSEDVTVSLSDMTITRESADSTGGDNSSFYGVGAAVLGTAGTTEISDSTITTDSAGGAGVFAYGDAVVYVKDTDISTTQDTSGGIHAAGGGTLYAWNLTAETDGQSAAAVRSDRGGGLMVVDGGTYTSNGSDSPAVYCTADISINDADLTANGSEAVCIEGLNTLRLYDCDLSGNMNDDDRNDNTWTVIVYQSMSGDSEIGNSIFQMVGGTLTSGNGGLFFTTNTECTITLEDVAITGADDCEFFLQCTGNTNSRGWGQTGSNGSDCLFTAIAQEMQGDVIWDSVSDLDFYMTEGSTLTGAVCQDETYAGEGGDGYCNMIISEDSVWTVTGDSQVSSLSVSGSIVDEKGNTVTIQGTDGTVYVEGDSEYTVTTGSYSDSADLSGASVTDSWEDHAVEWQEV